MKKKLLSVFAAAAVLLASSCSGNTPAQTTAQAPAQTDAPAQTEAQSQSETENKAPETEPAESESEDEEDIEDIANHLAKSDTGISMTVSGKSGKMSISRAAKKSTPMGDDDTWTVFIYLCGTDLESGGQGSATGDIMQILEAESSDKVKYVVQTGGTQEWMNEAFSADACERYIITDGDMYLADSVPLSNMGDPDTLADFLDWGVKTAPSAKMGVVFWDHGGGSISGACFDELNGDDSLSLSDINTAFSKVYGNMTDKFEFIGFDCCLMGTAETANIAGTYARYFYGSQELEPGTGWDYTAIGNFLAENPGADGAELGKVVADSFYDECAKGSAEGSCTFTIIDLDLFDEFMVAFNDYAKALYEAADSELAGIVRGAQNADNFGGNNKSEGYTNMVDIGGIISNCADYADGTEVLNALNNCISYNKNGSDHKNASGLSIYYPLMVEGSKEMNIFSGVCISPYYLSLTDMISKGYSDNGYSNSVFFTEDGDWYSDNCDSDYFDSSSYFDDGYGDNSQTSNLINFAVEPYLDEDGSYAFALDTNCLDYTASVTACIYMDAGNGSYVELGETDDIIADWEKGVFIDNFDGYWLSLPDNSLLATYIVDTTDDYTVFTSPVLLNGKRTNLRIRQYLDYTLYIEGAWDGIDENGFASREIKELKAGDEICPIYYLDDGTPFDMDPYTWQAGDEIMYGYLYPADYYYCFIIYDVYGSSVSTEFAVFSIDDDGKITFKY